MCLRYEYSEGTGVIYFQTDYNNRNNNGDVIKIWQAK